jgi:hypothetical protein
VVTQPILNVFGIPYGCTFQLFTIGNGTERTRTAIVCESDVPWAKRVLIVSQDRLSQLTGYFRHTDFLPSALGVGVLNDPESKKHWLREDRRDGKFLPRPGIEKSVFWVCEHLRVRVAAIAKRDGHNRTKSPPLPLHNHLSSAAEHTNSTAEAVCNNADARKTRTAGPVCFGRSLCRIPPP